MSAEWPTLLRFLSDELGYLVHKTKETLGFEIYTIDLSPWKLRLSSRTPVIRVSAEDMKNNAPQHLLQGLSDVMRERGLSRQIALVLVDGDSQPLALHRSLVTYTPIFVGTEEQGTIMTSRRPSGELLDLIAAKISVSNLSPYETRAPVTGSRFFGREHEISRIIANPDTNYAILGIRRIGKTSLLREIERILKEGEDPAHVVYLECSDLLSMDDYVREVVRKLNPRELTRLHLQKYVFFFPNFLERMSKAYKTKIIFLLDEIDNLVIMQRGNWELFRMLRASANKGACQYIIAGFREAMREQYMIDSPFYNFAQEIRLSEFTRQQAHDLIVTPMENLRVRIKNKEEVVNRIYNETSGQPNLIQYYCLILLRKLDETGEREISPDSLIDVYDDAGFQSHLLNSFMQNTKNREKALVYAVLKRLNRAPDRGFSQAYIDEALRRRNILLMQDEIDEACTVLSLAGVIKRKGQDFFFTSPIFTRMLLQTYDLTYLLQKVEEEGV